MCYPDVHLKWEFGSETNTLDIVEKTLDELNDTYSQIGRLNSNVTTVHTIYKLIEIDLYPHLVTLRNIHFVYRLANCDITELGSPEFPSDITIEKVLYSSQERYDVLTALLKLHWKHSSQMCSVLRRWLTKMLSLGKRLLVQRPKDNSLELNTLEAKVNTMQKTVRIHRMQCIPSVALTPTETIGLSPSFLQRFGKNNYAYMVRLDPESFNYIISSAHDPETRKKVFLTYYRETDETVFVDKLLKAEQDYAKQLGHKNSADMFFSNSFLKENSMTQIYALLSCRVSSALKRKMEVWLKHKQRQCTRFGYQFSGELELWDIDYCQETSNTVSYDKLSQVLVDYFPLSHVVTELLAMYEHLLGLKVSPAYDFPAWHQHVLTFSVRDAAPGNELLGYICLDLLSRKDKSDEPTYCYVLQPGLKPLLLEDYQEIAVVAVVSSFKECMDYSRVATEALLSHKEVVCLCRGLGSAFQGVCSRPAYTFYNTVVMEKDLLGVMGNFWDNFAWEPEFLRCMSCHYMSRKPIPEELLENLQKVRYDKDIFKVAVSVYNGRIDLEIRQGSQDLDVTRKTLYNYIFGLEFSKYLDFTVDNVSVFSLPLSRLYFYDLWCQIVSDDLYQSRFKINSVTTNTKVALEFRKTILEPFGTVNPYSMFKSFLGRKPNPEAFLKVRNL